MSKDEMKSLLIAALERLGMAAHRLTQPVHPHVPLPRPRVFRLTEDVQWPCQVKLTDAWWMAVSQERQWWLINHCSDRGALADVLLDGVGEQPRAVLRLLRRIDAAAAWCDARRRGMERATAELLRQQAKAVETLEAMAAVQAISNEGARQ